MLQKDLKVMNTFDRLKCEIICLFVSVPKFCKIADLVPEHEDS
jgi:hypothetical protein